MRFVWFMACCLLGLLGQAKLNLDFFYLPYVIKLTVKEANTKQEIYG